MLAQTWSKEIAEKFGEAMGQEYADIDNYGWYGPAMDTTPFSIWWTKF